MSFSTNVGVPPPGRRRNYSAIAPVICNRRVAALGSALASGRPEASATPAVVAIEAASAACLPRRARRSIGPAVGDLPRPPTAPRSSSHARSPSARTSCPTLASLLSSVWRSAAVAPLSVANSCEQENALVVLPGQPAPMTTTTTNKPAATAAGNSAEAGTTAAPRQITPYTAPATPQNEEGDNHASSDAADRVAHRRRAHIEKRVRGSDESSEY